MKFLKLSTALLLVTAMLFTACKGKSAKELIANKWHLTDVTGEGTKDMSAEAKKAMTDKLVMELTKDGKCNISGMGETPQSGTYSLSEDGKTLNLTRDGETAAEPQKIDELTAGKLVITDDKSKMQLSFKAQ